MHSLFQDSKIALEAFAFSDFGYIAVEGLSVTIVTENYFQETDLCYLINVMKRQKFMIIVIVLAVAAVVAAFGFRKSFAVKPLLPVELVNSDNQPISFESLKGKVVFVNNWASWCPPCIAEMPSIQELKGKLEDVDVEFVMVSFDEDPEKAMKFMTRRNFDFNIYFPGQEYPFMTSSIPATFIIDKNGNTVAKHIGMADYSGDEIVNQLKALANE